MIKTTPILLLPYYISRCVEDKMGVYVLGNSNCGFTPKYVGRSDTSIKNRLLNHNHLYDYEYFIFKYVDSEKEAFYLESRWWHDCINSGIDLDNKMHPDSPSGMFLECPYCSFKKNSLDAINRAS